MSGSAPTRVCILVGELLLSDGTRYTPFAAYQATDMERALRRAVRVVRGWQGERVEGHADTAVCDITEVKISINKAA